MNMLPSWAWELFMCEMTKCNSGMQLHNLQDNLDGVAKPTWVYYSTDSNQCSVVLQRPSNCESGNWNTNTADPCEERHSSNAVVAIKGCCLPSLVCYTTVWHRYMFHDYSTLAHRCHSDGVPSLMHSHDLGVNYMKLTKQWTNNAEMKVEVRYIMLEEDTFS